MSEHRKRETLQRVAFKTSRLADFCGVDELIKQCGHDEEDWPLVILKELLDNSLDACEEAEIPPIISVEVSTEHGEITVSDNGPGIPKDTIDGVLDFTVRVSSREAYVSPSRGQQGNALKTVIAMPYALDGNRGSTLIESQGWARELVFAMDRVRREPMILPMPVMPSNVKNGTRITVRWPRTACHLLEGARSRFLQLA